MGTIRTSPGCGCCGGTSCKANFRVLKCCTIPVAGATVTATLGLFSVSGATDSFGNVTLDISGGGPGEYTITASHDGLTSTTTAALSCGSSLVLDGGCTIAIFVADCCGNHLTGATVTVKDQDGNTVGTCTVSASGPIGLSASCGVDVPQAGTYTVSTDGAGVVNTPQTITTTCNGGAVTFHQDQSPPTSLTDPLGNTIGLTGGAGSFTYTIDLTSLPTYPGTTPPCQFTPDVRVDTPIRCSAPDAYTPSVQVTLRYAASRCELLIGVPLCYLPNGNPVAIRSGVDAPPPSGGSETAGGALSVQCFPYVGEIDMSFAPSPATVQNYCNDPFDTTPMPWLLSAIFGDGGPFTCT